MVDEHALEEAAHALALASDTESRAAQKRNPQIGILTIESQLERARLVARIVIEAYEAERRLPTPLSE